MNHVSHYRYLLSCYILAVSAGVAFGQDIAVVIGVEDYSDESLLGDLNHSSDDAREFAYLLTRHGYRVTLLSDESKQQLESEGVQDITPIYPSKNAITSAVSTACRRTADTLIVYLGGHGKYLKDRKRNVFCPKDVGAGFANAIDLETDILVPLRRSRARRKFFFQDACRDEGIAERKRNPNRGAAIDQKLDIKSENTQDLISFFSCSHGEESREITRKRHGLFSYYLLAALKGCASAKRSIDVETVFGWVEIQVNGEDDSQEPDPRIPDRVNPSRQFLLTLKPRGTSVCYYQTQSPNNFPGTQEALSEGDIAAATYVNATFHGQLSGISFQRTVFRDCVFQNCVLSGGSILKSAKFIDCEFLGKNDFRAAKPKNSTLLGTYYFEDDAHRPWDADSVEILAEKRHVNITF